MPDNFEGFINVVCCPNDPVPVQWVAWFLDVGHLIHCTEVEDVFFLMDWSDDVAPYGRWSGGFDVYGTTPLKVDIRPETYCVGAQQRWTVEVTYDSVIIFNAFWATDCGNLPWGWTLDQNRDGPCPDGKSLFRAEV